MSSSCGGTVNDYAAVFSKCGFPVSGKRPLGDELVCVLKRVGPENSSFLFLLESLFSAKEVAQLIDNKSIKLVIESISTVVQKGAIEENFELLREINGVIRAGCMSGVFSKELRAYVTEVAHKNLSRDKAQLSTRYYLASIIRRSIYSLDLNSTALRSPLYATVVRLILMYDDQLKPLSVTTQSTDEQSKSKNPAVALFISELFAILSFTVNGSKELANKDHYQLVPLLCSYISSVPSSGHASIVNHPRRQALFCLRAYTTSSPQLLYPHWGTLFPSVSTLEQGYALSPTSVFGIFLNDSDTEMRAAAGEFLLAFVTSLRPYMVAVTSLRGHSESAGSFTSFTQALGHVLCSVHRILLCALKKPSSSSSLVQKALLCLTKLAGTAPYERLGGELLSDAVLCVSPYLRSVDGLACLGAIVGALAENSMVASAVLSADISEHILTALSSTRLVVLEALKAFGALAKNYPEPIDWCKYRGPLLGLLSRGDGTSAAVVTALSVAATTENHGASTSLWGFIVPEVLSCCTSKEKDSLTQSTATSTLASIAPDIYNSFSRSQKDCVKQAITRSLGSSYPAVRAAGWGAFGVVCMIASDSHWVSRVVFAEESKVLRDPVQNVRVKALQAFGNCPSIGNSLDVKTMSKVAEVLVAAAADHAHEKVQVHALRGLTTIFSEQPDLLSQPQVDKACKAVVTTVLSKGLHPKTYWNACIVLGAVVASKRCAMFHADGTNALCVLLGSTQNYKVKTQASQALGMMSPTGNVICALKALGSELYKLKHESRRGSQWQSDATSKYRDGLLRTVSHNCYTTAAALLVI